MRSFEPYKNPGLEVFLHELMYAGENLKNNMYVCMCVCVYVCMYVCMYVCIVCLWSAVEQ